jgi:hypothetical protein
VKEGLRSGAHRRQDWLRRIHLAANAPDRGKLNREDPIELSAVCKMKRTWRLAQRSFPISGIVAVSFTAYSYAAR